MSDQTAQAQLGQAFGAGVNGGQPFFDGNRFVRVLDAVFRVVDFQTAGARPDFAVAAHDSTTGQGGFLCHAEMIEAQTEAAAAILQAHQQAAPFAHDHIGSGDRANDNRILSRTQCADWGDAGAVLIARG